MTLEHVVTDCESKRTFCLKVVGGSLVSLRELVPDSRYPQTEKMWVRVDKLSEDGGEWWEQWEGEVEVGEFS